MMISTRRFLARFSAEVLATRGLVSARPVTDRRVGSTWSRATRTLATAAERAAEAIVLPAVRALRLEAPEGSASRDALQGLEDAVTRLEREAPGTLHGLLRHLTQGVAARWGSGGFEELQAHLTEWLPGRGGDADLPSRSKVLAEARELGPLATYLLASFAEERDLAEAARAATERGSGAPPQQ